VCFEVKRGDVLGVIGRNGAGKSTLLKILSRITEPTTGRVTIDGRLASLLEVGTGFHPELSGRENIYLNGAILGMSRKEIRRKFDEIVAFAEIEKFLDTPVKRYSSGMYVRLAFAVAAHLEPEILVVDEVLAVGDTAFQKKCLGKMNEVASSGRTVLFVSHNMPTIAHLCNRAIFLEHGRVRADGPTSEMIALYMQDVSTTMYQGRTRSGKPSIRHVEIDLEQLRHGHLCVDVHFESPYPIEPLVGIVISSAQSVPLFGTNPLIHPDGYRQLQVRNGVSSLTIPDLPFYSGTYRLSVWLCDREPGAVCDQQMEILSFDFVSPRLLPAGLHVEVNGPFWIPARWNTTPHDVPSTNGALQT
jgi:lipopolysaccharide transport system ATP-binding protein